MATLNEMIDDFGFLDDWEDRMRYVIELGKALPDLPDSEKSAENKVQGCASQVWLSVSAGDGADPEMTFRGDSDAFIVRGSWPSCWRPIPARGRRRSSPSTRSTSSSRSGFSNT